MPHDRSVLADFQRGESRMIFAGRKSGEPGLFYLPEGEANKHRLLARADLRCPVEDCPTPDFTTVNRSRTGGRDGFRHLTGNFRHEPESLFHLEAKAQIARYLQAQHPTAVVVMEQASNKERERVADVMVTFADETRMAIEIQYSALTADDWQARHDSYQNQNITDVWLFGHTGAQLRAEYTGSIYLSPTQQAVAAAGGVPLWFNPLLMHIGIATVGRDLDRRKIEIYGDNGGNFTTEPLTGFTLHPDRLSSRRTDRIATDTVRYLAMCAAEDEERRRAKESKAAVERGHREWNADRRAAMQEAWLTTGEGQAMLDLFGGEIPEWLDAHVPVDIPAPNVMWQWHLWQTMVAPADGFDWVRRDFAVQELEQEFGLKLTDTQAMTMVTSWYDTLVERRLLRRSETKYSYRKRTVRYFKTGARGLVPAPRRAPVVRAAPGVSPAVTAQLPPAPVAATPGPEAVVCGRCRKSVDPPFARTGFHMRCAPGYTGF